MQKTTAIVAGLGIAFAVTACSTGTDSTPVAKIKPKATATATTTATSPAPTKAATTGTAVDKSLKNDLEYMATAQEIWITDGNPQDNGFAVTATKPGGTVTLSKQNVFRASAGNVITVKVSATGYCISGYNKASTMAPSATMSFLYKSDKGGVQADVGTCSQAAGLTVDAALRSDLKNMATIQETYITDHPNEMGVPVTATKPDGQTVIGGNRFLATPGNVIVVKVGPAGYCISGYNKAATKATSATKSMLYKSDDGGLQTAVGVC